MCQQQKGEADIRSLPNIITGTKVPPKCLHGAPYTDVYFCNFENSVVIFGVFPYKYVLLIEIFEYHQVQYFYSHPSAYLPFLTQIENLLIHTPISCRHHIINP